MSTTSSLSLSNSFSLGDAFAVVKKLFQQAAPAQAGVVAGSPDVWQLYRLSRGSDSVRPSVVSKLSELAS